MAEVRSWRESGHQRPTVTILANVGVILGIVVLAFELRQNQTMMRTQTRAAITQGFNDHIYHVTADEEISSLWARGTAAEELTSDERSRWTLLAVAQLRYYENVHYQYRLGLYSEDEFRGQREAWRRIVFRGEGLRRWFCESRPNYSSEFVAEIEALLTRPCD